MYFVKTNRDDPEHRDTKTVPQTAGIHYIVYTYRLNRRRTRRANGYLCIVSSRRRKRQKTSDVTPAATAAIGSIGFYRPLERVIITCVTVYYIVFSTSKLLYYYNIIVIRTYVYKIVILQQYYYNIVLRTNERVEARTGTLNVPAGCLRSHFVHIYVCMYPSLFDFNAIYSAVRGWVTLL